jgi:diketogulonate reductase-like aldo/keto reductase
MTVQGLTIERLPGTPYHGQDPCPRPREDLQSSVMSETIDVQGVRVPWVLYGTAWKEERTEELVVQALAAGFRGIDTANQRRHYFEAAVGAALARSAVPRAELFIQTKFTPIDGQDDRLPYDADADLTTQVGQSFARSLEHLGVAQIDSYVHHGPTTPDWGADDQEIWAAMEALQRAGRTRLLGISNISAAELAVLCRHATVPPAFVQNRCYARTGWDREVRAFCRDHGIVYQGFSLLTANQRALGRPTITELARRRGATVPQLVFAFARAVGMLPLTGTSDPIHMQQDLASLRVDLEAEEIAIIEKVEGP